LQREDAATKGAHDTNIYFDPRIQGIYSLLAQDEVAPVPRGFRYYRESGLNIVAHGSSGVGKTILALQMAMAARKAGYHVLYFTKDTPATVLIKRIAQVFGVSKGDFFLLRPSEPSSASAADANPPAGESQAAEWRPSEPPAASAGDDVPSLKEVTEKDLSTKEPPLWMEKGFLAFADFNDLSGISSWTDRYQNTSSPFDALGYLQPELRPLFDRLQEAESRVGEKKRQQELDYKGLFVVCDSLRPEIVEEHLRYQPQIRMANPGTNSRLDPGIFLFVMEGAEIPQTLSVAFPPDVHIRMAFRDERHGIRSRILQLRKTRYQKSLDEETPFIILGAREAEKYASRHPIALAAESPSISPPTYYKRKPGITVMPPVAQESTVRMPDHGKCEPLPAQRRVVRFGVEGLDGFTQEGTLAGGGTTLLVTQNRSGSTALSLHYLLAQIGDIVDAQVSSQFPRELVPRSVLYISLAGEVEDVLHTIWRHPRLRRALALPDSLQQPEDKGDKDKLFQKHWDELDKALQGAFPKENADDEGLPHGDRIYSVPLRHREAIDRQARASGDGSRRSFCGEEPSLFVYIPAFRWVTPDEALDGIARVLRQHRESDSGGKPKCRGCHRIDRVVLDRVGRLESRWPLVKEHDVFVSGLASLCRQSHAELMIIDDTAETTAHSGLFKSRWVGIAQNIIQLRRTSFHGTEAMTIELVRAAGRANAARRPYETVFVSSGQNNREFEMRIEDSFRGYTGLFTANPKRSKLLVELSYDEKNTPLYHELVTAKQNIEASTDDITVRLMGSGEWSGINSAYHDLSAASRDACHVVAIDGVWMESLIEAKILHPFEADELHKVLPSPIRQGVAAWLLVNSDSVVDRIADMGGNGHKVYLSLEKKVRKQAGPEDRARAWEQALKNPMPISSDEVAALERTVFNFANPTDRGRAFKRQYVTQSLTVALLGRDRKNPPPGGGYGFYDELRYAIPMRHNWGVLAIFRPDAEHVKHVFDKVCSVSGERRDRRNVEEYPAYCLLTRSGPTKSDDESLRKMIWSALWEEEEQETSGLTWDALVRFRICYWHDLWCGGWVDRALSEIAAKSRDAVDLWTTLFPRIDFFGLATSTPESVVSFLLELILGEVPFGILFKVSEGGTHVAPTPELYLFRNDDNAEKSLAKTLFLFCGLLSKSQRRQIAVGSFSGHQSIGPIRGQRMMEAADPSRSLFADWPAQIALFSREWLSTVPHLLPRYDVRQAIRLRHLPKGSASGEDTYWKKIGIDHPPSVGPSVGGPWYLGILRGGNADLGTDVMKDILAPEHEVWSSLSGSGGPVSKCYYEGSGEPSGGGRQLPYMEKIRQACENGGETAFPFDRNQIVNYLDVSPILYDMVRRAMDIQFDDEKELLPEKFCGARADRIRLLVRSALDRISDAQGSPRAETK
jgi:IstB-like ATP binding protein.